jgi:hypothetical protein
MRLVLLKDTVAIGYGKDPIGQNIGHYGFFWGRDWFGIGNYSQIDFRGLLIRWFHPVSRTGELGQLLNYQREVEVGFTSYANGFTGLKIQMRRNYHGN